MEEDKEYHWLGEHIVPEAKLLLAEFKRSGIRYHTSRVDEIRRAGIHGAHGTYARIAIYVHPDDAKSAIETQKRLLKIMI